MAKSEERNARRIFQDPGRTEVRHEKRLNSFLVRAKPRTCETSY